MGVKIFLNVFKNAIYYNPIRDLASHPFGWDFFANGIEKIVEIATEPIVKKLKSDQLLWLIIGLIYTNPQPELSHQHELNGGARKFSAAH